jgi:hypothetical protein
VHGLLFKIVPATDPKTGVSCEHFGAYHASISKSARISGFFPKKIAKLFGQNDLINT